MTQKEDAEKWNEYSDLQKHSALVVRDNFGIVERLKDWIEDLDKTEQHKIDSKGILNYLQKILEGKP